MKDFLKQMEEILKKPIIKSKTIDFGPYFKTRRREGENKVKRNQDQLKDFFDAVILEQDIEEKEQKRINSGC